MERVSLIILPILFLIIILTLISTNSFYLENTGETVSDYYEHQENVQGEGFRTGGTSIIEILKDRANPTEVKGKLGIWVEFVNKDSKSHRLITKYRDIDTGELKPGDTFKKSFGSTGEYTFTDKIDPEIIVKIIISE